MKAEALRRILKRRSSIALLAACALLAALWLFRGQILHLTLVPWATKKVEETLGVRLRVGGVSGTVLNNIHLTSVRTVQEGSTTAVQSVQFDRLTARYSLAGLLLRRRDWLLALEVDGLRVALDTSLGGLGKEGGQRLSVEDMSFPNVVVRRASVLVRSPSGQASLDDLTLSVEQRHDGLLSGSLGAAKLELAFGRYSRSFSDVSARFEAGRNAVVVSKAVLSPELRVDQLEIDTSDAQFPSFRGTIHLWGGSLSANSKTIQGEKLQVALEARDLDLAQALRDLNAPAFLTEGKLSLSMEGSMPLWDVRGISAGGDFAISQAARREMRFGDLESQFRLSGNSMVFEGTRLTRGSFEVTGSLGLDLASVTSVSADALSSIVVDGDARITAKDLSEIPSYLLPHELHGQLSADVKMRGALLQPDITFSAEAHGLGFRELQLDSVHVQGSFEGGELKLSSLNAVDGSNVLSASAAIRLGPSVEYSAEIDAEIADPAEYERLLAPGKALPAGTLQLNARAKGGAPALSGFLDGRYEASGKLLYEPSAESTLPSVQSEFRISEKEIALLDASFVGYGSTLRASASAKHRRGKLAELTIAELTGQTRNSPFALSRPTTLSITENSVGFQELGLLVGNGILSATGRVSPDALDVDLELREISTRALLMPALGDIRQEVILQGTVSLSGVPREPVVEAQLHGETPTEPGEEKLEFDIHARVSREDVALDNVTLTIAGRPILNGRGTLPFARLRRHEGAEMFGLARVELDARRISWSDLNPYLPPSWQGRGELSGRVDLGAAENGRILQADITASDIMLPGGLMQRSAFLRSAFPADLRTRLVATREFLRIEELSVKTPSGDAEANGAVPLADIGSWPPSMGWLDKAKPFTAYIEANNLRPPKTAPRWLVGTIGDVVIEAHGPVSNYIADIDTHVIGLNLPWPRYGAASADLEVTPDLVTVRAFALGEPETSGVQASGKIGSYVRPSVRSLDDFLPGDANLDLACTVRENSLGEISAALGQSDLFDGKLAAELAITGTHAGPVLALSVQGDGEVRVPVGDGGLLEDSWEIRGRAQYQSQMVSVEGLDVQFRDGRLALSGQCPMELRVPYGPRGHWPECPWTAQLVLESIDLSILATLIVPLRASAGLASGKLMFAGGATQPDITGRLHIQDGDVRISRHVPPLQNIDAEINIDYPVVAVAPSSAEMGAGKATFEGELTLNGFRFGSGRLNLSGEDLLLYRSPEVNCRADLSIQVLAREEDTEVSGQVEIRDLAYSREISFVPAGGLKKGERLDVQLPDAPWAESLALDVEIVADKSLRFRTDLFNGDASSQLHVGGTALLPILSGSVDIVGSVIRFPYCAFRVETGVVEFSESEPLRPHVTILARGKRSGYEITLGVTGPYDRPSVYLSSVPAAPAEDLWTLILTGHTPASLMEAGAGRTAALQVGKYLGQSLVRKLARQRGGEEIADWTERISITIGADQSASGADVIDAIVVLTDNIELHAERDEFDAYNMDVVFVLRFR